MQTVDFFSPVVDDPFTYGQIAAANALSDVYALGARPVTALNLVGFPSKVLSLETLERILAGGLSKTDEAGVAVIGGHTVEDPEPKFGLAVTGLVDPAKAVLNRGARPGHRLLLTKAIGTGVVSNAIKKGIASPAAIEEAVASMARLNRRASELMLEHGAAACTDVTGFGLLGHLHNLLAASGVAARLRASAVPLLEGARELAVNGSFPGGSRRNLDWARGFTRFDAGVSETSRLLLADAQTSGGLLVALAPEDALGYREALAREGLVGAEIGEIEATKRDGEAGTIEVV